MNASLTIESLFNAQFNKLSLEWVAGKIAANRELGRNQVRGKRPSLIGYLNLIRPNRIQIIGIPEFSYLQEYGLDTDAKKARRVFQNDINIIIFSDDQTIPECYYHLADGYQVALMRTTQPGHELISSLQHFTSRNLAESMVLHGVFMDVLGIGVLITGDSSVGKSELALELGHPWT